MQGICRWIRPCTGDLLPVSTIGGSEQMVLALWSRVPTTLYLDGSVWWLSHYRYRSVCVAFLKTVLLRLPSSFGKTHTSRNGRDPSSLCSSTGKLDMLVNRVDVIQEGSFMR